MPDAGLLNPLSHGSREDELTGDRAWLQAMVDAELALTRALVETRLVPDWMDGVCDGLASSASLDLAVIAAEGRGGGNPVIPLARHLGRAAESIRQGASDHIHVGATSQDILDTALMLVAQRVLTEVGEHLAALAGTLATLADTHRGTVMAGRTLGQQAAPTSLGFVAAGWLDEVTAVLERTRTVRASLPAQLGGAVGNLAVLTEIARTRRADAAAAATVDEVIAAYAARLGLVSPRLSWHTNRVVVTELASVLAAATGVAGAFALDVTVLARTEISEVNERLGAGQGGSSAMPHKRNPVTAVLIVAAARQSPALLATLYSSLLAEDQRPSGSWHAEWQSLRSLEGLTVSAVTAAASLAERLDVDAERMRGNLELTDGLVFSERVTTILAEALGRSAAFALVEKAAAESLSTNRPLRVTLAGLLADEIGTTGRQRAVGAEDRNDLLRTRLWNAFDDDRDLGHSDTGIDRALERFRASVPDTHTTVVRTP